LGLDEGLAPNSKKSTFLILKPSRSQYSAGPEAQDGDKDISTTYPHQLPQEIVISYAANL